MINPKHPVKLTHHCGCNVTVYDIIAAVKAAGFAGVKFDIHRLHTGETLNIPSLNVRSIEGKVLEEIILECEAGIPTPCVAAVLNRIVHEYREAVNSAPN